MSTNGKGSTRRGDREADKRYAEGWARIFGDSSVPKNSSVRRKSTHIGTKSVQKPYPSWVCSDCATKAGGKMRWDYATWHYGQCEVCRQGRYVTQPRDYGYPAFK